MPQRASTDEQVAARACVMVGVKPITSFSDDTTEAQACSELYEDIITDVMTATRWRFTVFQAHLNKLSTGPTSRWEAAWQLPSDLLQVVAVTTPDAMDRIVEFERYEDKIYTDDFNDVVLDFVRRVPVSQWPPYFTTACIYALAAELAIAINQNEQLGALHAQKYERKLAQGKTADAQGRTTSVLRLDLYDQARLS